MSTEFVAGGSSEPLFPFGLHAQEIICIDDMSSSSEVEGKLLSKATKCLLVDNFDSLKGGIKKGNIGGISWVSIIKDEEEELISERGIKPLADFLKSPFEFESLKSIKFKGSPVDVVQERVDGKYTFRIDGESVPPWIALTAFYLSHQSDVDSNYLTVKDQAKKTREAYTALLRYM